MEMFDVDGYPYIAKPAKIYKEIECFSNFFIITDSKGKTKIIKGETKDG